MFAYIPVIWLLWWILDVHNEWTCLLRRKSAYAIVAAVMLILLQNDIHSINIVMIAIDGFVVYPPLTPLSRDERFAIVMAFACDMFEVGVFGSLLFLWSWWKPSIWHILLLYPPLSFIAPKSLLTPTIECPIHSPVDVPVIVAMTIEVVEIVVCVRLVGIRKW